MDINDLTVIVGDYNLPKVTQSNDHMGMTAKPAENCLHSIAKNVEIISNSCSSFNKLACIFQISNVKSNFQ